ncbi:hypothetical protein HAX54_037007 [Datura stramonium]|uniref:Uncharacterized protein n=1 Tax=Datura stramonium TaxID=4076 RepID=A0ABS8VKP7_DATST|nr:hypothetical protein [Datura stramonium]
MEEDGDSAFAATAWLKGWSKGEANKRGRVSGGQAYQDEEEKVLLVALWYPRREEGQVGGAALAVVSSFLLRIRLVVVVGSPSATPLLRKWRERTKRKRRVGGCGSV